MAFRTSDINQLVKISRRDGDFEPITLVELFDKTVNEFPDHDALAYKDSSGEWIKITYKEYKNRVEKMAKVLIKMGLKQRGIVAVLAWNSVEWLITALTAIYAGGVITGIYTTNNPSACEHILKKSKAQIVVVDDEKQLEKINQIKENLPDLIEVIETSKFLELIETQISDEIEILYQTRLKEIVPNQCCAVIYTSGTTGFPKGAMLSHDNLIWQTATVIKALGCFERGKEITLSYLPLSHVAAFDVDLIVSIYNAATVYFTDKNALKGSLLQYLQEVQPTSIFSVPRVYEKIEEKFKEKTASMSFFKRKFIEWAQSVILESYQNMTSDGYLTSLKVAIAHKFVSDPFKKVLGFERCKIFFTGSAPTRQETKKFFMSLDMPLLDAYGMSETLIHTLQSLHTINDNGNLGQGIDGVETKIFNKNDAGEGEICMRGRHVCMGYLNDPEKTTKTIDDEGWLHSGDIGYMDENGFLYMKGRIKELIITSGGENIPAALIENAIKSSCPAISNAFLVGDNRKYLTMLLTLKTKMNSDGSPRDELAVDALNWLKSKNINHKTLKELLDDKDQLNQALQKVFDDVNSKAISHAQKVQKFAILPHDFSIKSELTPTLKVKRNVVVEKYKDVIEELYSSA